MDNGHAAYDLEGKMYSWRGRLLPLGGEATPGFTVQIPGATSRNYGRYDCCTNVNRTAKPIRRLPNNHCCTRWAEGER